jgi:adenylate cyclase
MSSPAYYRRSFLSWFVPSLVLLLLACVMTLDLGGITSALQQLQHDAWSRWSGTTTGVSLPVALSSQTLGAMQPEAWGSNAAALWPQLWLLFAAGLVVLVLLGRRRTIAALVITLLIIAPAGGLSWLLFVHAKLFFDSIDPSVALALVWLAGALVNASLGTRRRAAALSIAAPPAAASERIDAPEATGAKRPVVYLSCSVRGFPSMLDSFDDAAHAAAFVAHATGEFRALVPETRGTVATTSVDRFAAAWNAPRDDSEAAAHACEAATRMMAAAAQIKLPGARDPENTIAMSAGIAGGPALAGHFANGALAVAGACVDRAEMLRVLSAKYGPAVLVGQEIRNAAEKGFAFVEVDTIAADNRAERVYALLGNALVRASPKFRALSTFHEHLFQSIRDRRWADARKLIDQCRNLSGAIPRLYDLHLARIEWYESHPPPSDWDGAFRPPVA